MRLKDFREKNVKGTNLFTASASNMKNEEIDIEITKVIQDFEKKGCSELPQKVLHMYNFKRPYYRAFLPRLLELNRGEVQNSRQLLVQKLLESGKIPNDLKTQFSL